MLRVFQLVVLLLLAPGTIHAEVSPSGERLVEVKQTSTFVDTIRSFLFNEQLQIFVKQAQHATGTGNARNRN